MAGVYHRWETKEKLSCVISLEEARAADYNLSPSQFIQLNKKEKNRPIDEIMEDLAKASYEREQADLKLREILSKLGLGKGLQ